MSDEPISPASNDSDINKELAAEQSSGDATPKKKSVRVSGRKSAQKKSASRKAESKDSSDDSQELPLNEGGGEESGRQKGPKTVVREVRTKLVDSEPKDGDDSAPANGDKDAQGDDAPKKQGRQRGQGRQQNKTSRKRSGGERNERQERVEINEKSLRKKAWKIFLAEVSEEGLALVSKSDAHRLAQRSFDVARAFLEEIERMKK